MKFFVSFFLLLLVLFTSCNSKKSSQTIVTERIQYDVPIVTHDPELNWWVKNIEGSKCDALIKQLMTAAAEGEVKTYDFFSNLEFKPKKNQTMICKIDTLTVERFDGTLVQPFEMRFVCKILAVYVLWRNGQ